MRSIRLESTPRRTNSRRAAARIPSRVVDTAGNRFFGRRPALRHRANAASRAISRRRDGESLAARAFPPIFPPTRPSATACLFRDIRERLSICYFHHYPDFPEQVRGISRELRTCLTCTYSELSAVDRLATPYRDHHRNTRVSSDRRLLCERKSQAEAAAESSRPLRHCDHRAASADVLREDRSPRGD